MISSHFGRRLVDVLEQDVLAVAAPRPAEKRNVESSEEPVRLCGVQELHAELRGPLGRVGRVGRLQPSHRVRQLEVDEEVAGRRGVGHVPVGLLTVQVVEGPSLQPGADK